MVLPLAALASAISRASGDRRGLLRTADERGDAAGAFNLAVLLEEDGDYAGALSAYQRADQDGNPEIAEMARTAALALETQAERPTAVAERGGSGGS